MRRFFPVFNSIPWPSPIRFRRRPAPPLAGRSEDPAQPTAAGGHCLPGPAPQSLLDRLERVHNLTLPEHDHVVPSSSTSTTSWDPEAVARDQWGFSLRRLPSTISGAGQGLFLTSGRIEKGEVITLFPGVVYRIPYDLESCMSFDNCTLQLRPPDFLCHNHYLLRFHDAAVGQHVLIDGCPRGLSALNYIKAMQQKMATIKRLGNIEWLEGTSTSHQDMHQPSPLALTPLCENHLNRCRKALAGYLGMGHLINDSYDPNTHQALTPTVEFHLYQLPPGVPEAFQRYLPNVAFSDRLEGSPYTVLVCATETLEAHPHCPTELLARYTRYKMGFSLF